jgi:TPR repeat protein
MNRLSVVVLACLLSTSVLAFEISEIAALAEQGFAPAQYSLGVAYDTGEGVQQNHVEAVKWYRRAAEQGHVRAQNNLGASYGRGEGVHQDYTEAVKWYRRAARQGDALAKDNLAANLDKI